MATAPLTIELLKSETGVTDQQLDHVIEERHTWQLAADFSDCDNYLGHPGLGLTESEKVDVRKIAYSIGNQKGMQLALNIWIRKHPYRTYRSLVEIFLELQEGPLADKVCRIACKFSNTESAESNTGSGLSPVSSGPSSDTDHDMEGLTIERKIEIFEDRFVDLRRITCTELENKGTSPQDLRITLMTLPSGAARQHRDFITNNYPIFQKAKTIEEIFIPLNFYLSFLNYNLLAHIVKHFGSQSLQQRMKSYSKDMMLFQKETMISDIVPYLRQEFNCPKDYSKLELKVDIDITTTSLEDLEEIRKQFANEFLLPNFALFLANLRKSSLLIVWLIPSDFIPTLVKSIEAGNKSSFFAELHVFEISADGAIVFDATESELNSNMDTDIQKAEDSISATESVVASHLSSDSDTFRQTRIPRRYLSLMRAMSNGESTRKSDTSVQAMDYFDIMILGLTGQGKTTTADKLLIANPTPVDYSLYEEAPTMGSQQVTLEDLSAWFIPNENFSFEQISTRMKNLVFYRRLENPHLEINAAHDSDMYVNQKTVACELFSNETTRVRVLDVPGFFGVVRNANHDISHKVDIDHFNIMGNILQIQVSMAMRFKRILYFLPCRDSLRRPSAALQQELVLMFHCYGRSIFEAMVLVATLGPSSYNKGDPVTMSDEELELSRRNLQDMLRVFLPDNTPNPPIIFISLRDTCEEVLKKVQDAEVAKENLRLELNFFECAHCSMTVGERNGERVACITSDNWSQSILNEHSYCHPYFVPKYTTLQKVTEWISYTLRTITMGEQQNVPDLSAEVCSVCQQTKGTKGCMKLGSKYKDVVIEHVKMKTGTHRLLRQEEEMTAAIPSTAEIEESSGLETLSTEECSDSIDAIHLIGYQEEMQDVHVQRQKVKVDIEPPACYSQASIQ